MVSTGQKILPKHIPFLLLAIITGVQWPTQWLMHHVSLPLGLLVYEWLLIAGLPLLTTYYKQIPFQNVFPFQSPSKKELFYLCLMTFSLLVVIDYLTFWSEKILPPPQAFKTMLNQFLSVASWQEGLFKWFLICLTPSICEELFFRGMFQSTLQSYWGKKWSFILTGVLFALIHGMPWYWHLYICLGLYLSWLFLKSGNLLLPVLAHLINNSWTFLNHILGTKLPMGGVWENTDSLVFGVCCAVFLAAAHRFNGLSSKEI